VRVHRPGIAGVTLVALALVVVAPGSAGAHAANAGALQRDRDARPLAGLVIALDPGHQLGNANPAFARYLAQSRFNGVEDRGCNTTGTATNGGYPESTFVWNVAQRVRSRLERQGATVYLTRTTNSYREWGPCVWDRGRFGARVGADLTVSIHADGAAASGHGFFIVTPSVVPGWTDDIAAPSARVGRRMVSAMTAAGAVPSTYISGGLTQWNYLSTLNFSDVPIVLIELGNMRNPTEARRMVTARGQATYAAWVVAGIRAGLRRG
jgi:N-acetylmuramoyl-L-alanine amidase